MLNFFHYLVDGFPHLVFVPSSNQCRLFLERDRDKYMTSYTGLQFMDLVTFNQAHKCCVIFNHSLEIICPLHYINV